MTTPTLTTGAIRFLRDEAEKQGDEETVDLCDRAIGGDRAARQRIAAITGRTVTTDQAATAVVNHTPHTVVIVCEDGRLWELPAVQPIPRYTEVRTHVGTVPGPDGARVAVTQTRLGDPVDVPPYLPGTLRIVSRMVAASLPGRQDLVCPDDLVRDEGGRVVGCRALARP